MAEDCIHAVLIEPQLERFRVLCGLDGVGLTTSFEGWHRHAVLAPDRVFLFPRNRSWVPGLRREMAVLKALHGRGAPAPRLLGHWHDYDVSPYPFIAVSRLPGRLWSQLESAATLEQLTSLLEALGRAIASWHRIPWPTLPRGIPRRQNDAARFLTTTLEVAAHDVAGQLGLPRQRARAWLRELEPLAALPSVLVHGDVHEGQILVDDTLQVTGILDWETAHLGNPLKDFDFGEWGDGIFAWDSHFVRLHRHLWEAYATARGGDLPSWRAVHLFFCLSWAYGLSQRPALDDWGRARLATTLDRVRQLEDLNDLKDVRTPRQGTYLFAERRTTGDQNRMNVGILGSGAVGQTIAAKLVALGHEVTLGTRDVDALLARPDPPMGQSESFGAWHRQNPGVALGTFAAAAASAEIVFNCTAGGASLAALQLAGADALNGKVLIDVANALDFSRGMPPTLSVVNNDSLGEQIQRAFPEVRVVKTLNTVTAAVMVDPRRVADGDHHIFVSGNDAAAKAQVTTILTDWFGWRQVIDLGDITTARGTEMYLPLWLQLMGALDTPLFNLKIVR